MQFFRNVICLITLLQQFFKRRVYFAATEVSLREAACVGGSISAPAPPKRRRGAQIFPRAKARNRGHSSSWEGPRAPRSLSRSVHPGTKNNDFTGAAASLDARGAVASRTGALKANENRAANGTIWHARLSKNERLICVSLLTKFRHWSYSILFLFNSDKKRDF